MYSNKINAFFFFFIILCFAPLISADGSQLRVDYYDDTCPLLNDYVLWIVSNATKSDPRMPASLLRLHFHDCFVNGCDASVLLDGPQGEQNAVPNKNSLRGFEVIDYIKKVVETWCQPKTVSCADILTLAARAAVQFALLPGQPWWYYASEPWEVVLGRLDGMTSNMAGANRELPGPNDPVDTIIKKFAAKGLNIQDMVALSGAHTIGLAKCSSFKSSRLYPSKGVSTMDPKLLKALRQTCPNKKTSDNNTAALDGQTPTIFDNKYYENIMNNEGVLKSDQALESDSRTKRWVNIYEDNPESFLTDFAAAMLKMGNISLITTGSNKGEIRTICGSTN